MADRNENGRLKSLFMEALEKPSAEERAGYIEQECGNDEVLRERLRALLNAHDRCDPLLDRPAVEQLDGSAYDDDHDGIKAAAEASPSLGDQVLALLEPTPRPDSLGRLDHYEVLQLIGEGGMGVVLRAFDEKLHRVVAIKVPAPVLASSDVARKRFVREARAAAAVAHENIVGIHGVEDRGPIPYLVMQYVEGSTLQEKLDAGESLSTESILRIGLQIAEGLAAAHRQGLVHRDIKPANILLENDVERVKLTDFGLARAIDDSSLTYTGYIAGTPLYMSPEQVGGLPIDHRSDLFSLGSVLYYMCAGRPPFQAENTIAVLKSVSEVQRRPLRELNPDRPEWLEAVIVRLHAKDPAERFESAADVATLFRERLAQVKSDDPASSSLKSPEKGARDPGLATMGAATLWRLAMAVGLVGLIAAGWLIHRTYHADRGVAKARLTPTSPAPGPTERAERIVPAEVTESRILADETADWPLMLKPLKSLHQHNGPVYTVAFSPDGSTLATGSDDRTIVLWKTETWEVRETLRGHQRAVSCVAFSPDGRRLASVSGEPEPWAVRIWDIDRAKQIAEMGPDALGQFSVGWSPDGQTVYSGGIYRTIHAWDVATAQSRRSIDNATENYIRGLSLLRDGTTVVAGGSGPTRLWDMSNGQSLPCDLPSDMVPICSPVDHELAGWFYRQGRVAICSLPSGDTRLSWRAHPAKIEGICYSPDGRFLATVGDDADPVCRVWRTVDGRLAAVLRGHASGLYGVAFSPDGALLATGGTHDQTVRIWNVASLIHARQNDSDDDVDNNRGEQTS